MTGITTAGYTRRFANPVGDHRALLQLETCGSPPLACGLAFVRCSHQQNGRAQPRSRAVLAMSDDRPASVADIVVEELRKKEINGPIRLPKWDFFTRGQKLKVKDPWHILSGYDLEFAGMSTRERVRVMLEWFGRRQTIAHNKFGRWLPDCR